MPVQISRPLEVKMLNAALSFAFLLIFVCPLAFGRDCPCADSSLCKTMATTTGKEVFAWTFDHHRDVWKQYDWDKITTIAIFHHWDDELFCYAHSKGVRVVMTTSYPTNNLDNDQERYAWVENMTQYAKDNFADGINIDIEGGIAQGSKEVNLLTELVELTVKAFKKYIPGSQVTFDVVYTPDCRYSGRCYDYKALADAVDFLIIMAYDETGFASIAGANSHYYKNILGIQLYKKLNISGEKLAYGVPWYGYDYTCAKVDPEFHSCHTNCSNGQCRQLSYSLVQDLLASRSDSGRQFDDGSLSPFFWYNDEYGTKRKVWYDDPYSLGLKYEYALKYGKMKGIAVWNVDLLDYGGLTRGGHQTKMMWEELPDLKHING